MKELKLAVYYTGRLNSCVVSMRTTDGIPDALYSIPSLSDLAGSGGCFEAALEDFRAEFDEYLESLIRFRDEVLDTERAFNETIDVDFAGRPTEIGKKTLREQAKKQKGERKQ